MNYKMDVVTESGFSIRVVFLPHGQSENYPAASDNNCHPMVEFYDKRYDFTPDGQFTGGRYFLEDLLNNRNPFEELNLGGGWVIDGDSMNMIIKWLKSFEVTK